MRKIRIGRHFVPLWLAASLLVSGIGLGALAYHVWNILTIPLEVMEPLEALSYPPKLSLFPGETRVFNVTVQNHASVNYSVVLSFALDNTTYQNNYVAFDEETHVVFPGVQNVTTWLSVESYAPAFNVSLTIQLKRVEDTRFFDEFSSATPDSRWNIVDPDGGSSFDLTARSGWLRMTTTSPPGRDLIGSVVNAPRIMLTGICGDFAIETRVMAIMDENDEGAGILVWKDPSSYLRFERMSRTIGNPVEQQILFAVEGGDWTYLTLSTDLNPTYLRLVRAGNLFSGYYSSDGDYWHHVGDLTFIVNDPVDVGLDLINVYHDGVLSADFDYFRLSTEG